MLIQKSEPSKVMTFKLSTGEEIITRVDRETDTTYFLKKPFTLIQGPHGFGMMPASISADPESLLELNKDTIVFKGETQSDLASQYMEKTTGIIQAKGILPA